MRSSDILTAELRRPEGPLKRRQAEPYTHFYNNCLISRALIGLFLSSRVQTDKILIYANF